MRLLSHEISPKNSMLILTWVIIACTVINVVSLTETGNVYIDSELRPYVNNFKFDAIARGQLNNDFDISVVFGLEDSPEIGIAGICKLRGAVRTIEIKEAIWGVLSEEEKEALIYHELAHCFLKRSHCEEIRDDAPVSLMYPSLIDGPTYKNNREKYVNELFKADALCE